MDSTTEATTSPADRPVDPTAQGEPSLTASVVIATWRRPESLRRALEGLLKQSHPIHQLLIAVRPDDTPSREVVAEFAQQGVQEVLTHRPGAIAARNAALEVASGDFVAFTDDDAVPTTTWLADLESHYLSDPRIGAVGGRDRVYRGGSFVEGELANVGQILPYGRWITMLHLGAGEPRDVDLLKGVNMSFRREWLPELRFDTHLRGQGAEHHEDNAFGLAVAAAGYRVVYDPAVLVDHYEEDRGQGDPRINPRGEIIANWAHNQVYCMVRYLPRRRAVIGVIYALLVGTVPTPGLVMGLRRLGLGQSLREVGSAVSYAYRGRVAGIRNALQARRNASAR